MSRDEFVAKLGERGIGAGVYYPRLVFDYPTYRDRDDVITGEFPVAERVVQEVVSLPVHPSLGRGDLDRIIAEVASIVDEA